jgi:hypothetical protein
VFVNFFRENLQAIGVIKEEPAYPEESVMLHLRARGLMMQARKKLFLTLLVGFFVGLLMDVIMLPVIIFRRLPSLVTLLIVGLILSYFFGFNVSDAFIYSLIIYLSLNAYAIFWQAFLIIFDFLDIITYGSLTRLWLLFYFMRPDTHKEHHNNHFKVHIFCSRQLMSTDKLFKEGNDFFHKSQEYSYSDEAKKKLVENYWENIGSEHRDS